MTLLHPAWRSDDLVRRDPARQRANLDFNAKGPGEHGREKLRKGRVDRLDRTAEDSGFS